MNSFKFYSNSVISAVRLSFIILKFNVNTTLTDGFGIEFCFCNLKENAI